MLDFVVVALVLIVPILIFSLYTVKIRKNFLLHRNLQLLLGIVLLVAVALFEVDLRMQGGWQAVVNKGDPKLTPEKMTFVARLLYVHLVFAISTPVMWITTIGLALNRFSNPPQPGPHSRWHKTLGWLSTIDITLTSVTGLAFYYMAFVNR
jgi:membrane-associated HD superfamily phosphohydrolase